MENWDGWLTLLMVVETGTLSGAAAQLRIDATTIGRRLDRLEAKPGPPPAGAARRQAGADDGVPRAAAARGRGGAAARSRPQPGGRRGREGAAPAGAHHQRRLSLRSSAGAADRRAGGRPPADRVAGGGQELQPGAARGGAGAAPRPAAGLAARRAPGRLGALCGLRRDRPRPGEAAVGRARFIARAPAGGALCRSAGQGRRHPVPRQQAADPGGDRRRRRRARGAAAPDGRPTSKAATVRRPQRAQAPAVADRQRRAIGAGRDGRPAHRTDRARRR